MPPSVLPVFRRTPIDLATINVQTTCNWVPGDIYVRCNIYLGSEHCRRQHRGKPVAEVAALLPASRKQFAAGYPATYDVIKEFNIQATLSLDTAEGNTEEKQLQK